MIIDVYLRKNARKDGASVLQLRATHNRKNKYLSLRIYIKPNEFKNGKVIKSHPQHLRINRLIREKITFYENKVFDLESQNIEPSVDTIFQDDQKQKEEVLDFVEEAKQFLAKYRLVVKPNTSQLLTSSINAFGAFKPNLKVNKVTQKTFQDFHDFLLTKYKPKRGKSMSGTSCVAYAQKMNFIYNKIAKERNLPLIDIDLQNRKKDKKDRSFLTKKELLFVFKKYFSEELNLLKSERMMLRMFLFSCFTGLRYSDIIRFDREEHIVDNKIVIRMQKSSKVVTIPINPYSAQLLEEEEWREFATGYYNRRIKKIMKDVGVKKYNQITFHSARHTFATTCLSLDMNIKVVSKLLGHSSVKTTEIYTKIVDNVLEEEMGKFEL